MSPEQLERLRTLFKAALEQPPDRRRSFVETACDGDPELLQELLSLLNADEQAEEGSFLKEPALEMPIDRAQEETLVGQTFGAYRLQRLLGVGGMGQVYLALREQPFKQYVALKLIQHGPHHRELRQRFEMERQILASLNHPNIARLLDGHTTSKGRSYLVMEYVEGMPITRYCDEEQLAVPERLALFEQVCQAVHYAHQNLVVHRDLKPSNIFVTHGSGPARVKLLDFGVAKLLNPAMSNVVVPITRTMYRMMTPEYAAPEQVRGQSVTTATDVYALGVLLYELLTGHRPYRIATVSPVEMERIICEQEPERPSTRVARDESVSHADGSTETLSAVQIGLARGVTIDRLRRRLRGDLDNIILKALRKEPHLRYGSVEQLAIDIRRYLEGRPVEARPSTLSYRLRRYVRRNRVAVGMSVIVLASLLVGLSLALWQAQVARGERDRAEALFSRSEAVKGFLINLFQASNPFETRGDTLTAHDLLARGVERVDTLDSEPLVQAEILRVVGRVYRMQGAYEQAEPLLRQALTLHRQALGPAHPDIAENLEELSFLLSRKGGFEEAEALAREALAMQRALLGAEHPTVAGILNALGSTLQQRGAYDEAERILRESLALRRKLYEAESDQVVTAMNNVALLLHLKGDYEESERLFRQVVALDRKTLEPDDPELANDLPNLALLLVDQGAYAEAEPLFRESLAISRRVLSPEHRILAKGLHGLGRLLLQTGRYEEAEPLLQEALTINRRRAGETHPWVGHNLRALGRLAFHRGDYEAAASYVRRALTTYRTQLGDAHPYLGAALRDLAEVLQAEGDTPGALQRGEEALAMQRTLLGEAHPDVAATLHTLGEVVRDSGDLAAAQPLLEEALSIRQASLAPAHPDIAASLQSLGRLRYQQGDYPAAESSYQEALAILQARFPEAHAQVRSVKASFVQLYEAWDRPDQAAPYRAPAGASGR